MIQLRKHGKFVPALLSFWNEACFEGDCGSFLPRYSLPACWRNMAKDKRLWNSLK